MSLWAPYWEIDKAKYYLMYAFLANVISGIISTLQLWCDCSMLSTESPQVAWEENSRVDSSRHGIQPWQLEHFLRPMELVALLDLTCQQSCPGGRTDWGASVERAQSHRGTHQSELNISLLFLKYFPQTCQCLESVKLGVRRRRDLQSQDHPPARWWRWDWLGSNVVRMGNQGVLKTFHRALDNSLGWFFCPIISSFWILVETF